MNWTESMPVFIDSFSSSSITLTEFVESYEALKIDTKDHEDLLRATDLLCRLKHNRDFVGDYLLDLLKDGFSEQIDMSKYSAQSIMLGTLSVEKNYFLRVNFWPPDNNTLTMASGRDAFVYDYAHDHNFNFLTVGYLGSGYASDHYEYNYTDVDGYVGENVDLVSKGRRLLKEGDIHCYRAHVDVHNQLPPDELSASINIMQLTPGSNYNHQYAFDLSTSKISEVISYDRDPMVSIFSIMASLLREESKELLLDIGRKHFSQNMQLGALIALASTTDDENELEDLFKISNDSKFKYVREMMSVYAQDCKSVMQRC